MFDDDLQAVTMSELKIPSFQTSEQVGNLGTQQAAQTRHKRPPETGGES